MLYILNVEKLTFQTSQERKQCDQRLGHSAWLVLTLAHTHMYIMMALPRSPMDKTGLTYRGSELHFKLSERETELELLSNLAVAELLVMAYSILID